MRENADQNNSEYGHLQRSESFQNLNLPGKNIIVNVLLLNLIFIQIV